MELAAHVRARRAQHVDLRVARLDDEKDVVTVLSDERDIDLQVGDLGDGELADLCLALDGPVRRHDGLDDGRPHEQQRCTERCPRRDDEELPAVHRGRCRMQRTRCDFRAFLLAEVWHLTPPSERPSRADHGRGADGSHDVTRAA